MSDNIEPKKLLHGLNPFDGVLWVKSIFFGLRLALVVLIVLLVLSFFRGRKVTQTVTIKDPTGPVYIQAPDQRGAGLDLTLSSRTVGLTFSKEFQEKWTAGIGCEYDFDNQKVLPLVQLRWRFW